MSETFNDIPWRRQEDLDAYAVRRNVPVWIGGKKVIADRVVKTCCPHNCYDTCGELVYVKDEKVIKIEGDPAHPITKGHLCLKGFANVQKINSPDRVKYPLLRTGERGEGKFRRISWDEAMDWMVDKIQSIQKTYGPEAILEYCYSGNREHMAKAVAGRLWNLMGASKLVGSFCLLSGVAGSVGCVGSQYTMDPQVWADHAQTLFLVGRNCTATNPHIFPFLYRAKERGATIIVVDPYATGVAAKADIHLRPRPGTDGALALGMIHWILAQGLEDKVFIAEKTTGFEELAAYVKEWTPELTERVTTVPKEQIIRTAEILAKTDAMFETGYGQQRYSNGHQTQQALACLAAVCGSFGKPSANYDCISGMAFPGITGFANGAAVSAPKGADIPKTRLVNIAAVARAVHEAQDPPIKGILSYRGGLISQQPDVDYTIEAVKKLDMFVTIEQFMTDDTDYADLVLPACHYLEQYGVHPSYWHNWHQILVPVCQPPYECVPDAEIFAQLGRRLGYEAYFPRETSGLDWCRMLVGEQCDFDAIVSPNGPARNPEKWCPEVPYQTFDTPSGKFEFHSSLLEERGKRFAGHYDPLPVYYEPDESVEATPELAKKYPINIISQHPSFRTHSQYYNLPWIREIEGEARVFLSRKDAEARGIRDGDKVRIFNDRGQLENITARVGIRLKPGVAEMSSGMWVKLGGSVNKLTKLVPAGPRDILAEDGILTEYDPLLDGNTGSYFNTLVEISRMEEQPWK
ncbi:MAG: molybdopterin-dependent oxidoreductase [Clostridia bacterium]|nr:molybdopterin-dependent oxidoreductase [Clostridia bacterium]